MFLYITDNQISNSTTSTPASTSSLNPSRNLPTPNSLNPSQILPTPKSTLSYEEFRKRKQVARTKKIQSAKKAKSNEEVKVQVGVLEADGGKLKRLKGRTLPLVIASSCNADNLLKAAIEKHAKHFKQFDKYADYLLLYHDHSIVQRLPGSSEDFVLSEYKKDLGKPYSKIYFYLCCKIDLERVKDFAETESDDDILMPRGEEKKQTVKLESAINISDDDEERKSFQSPETSCPTCFRMFPFDQIEAHANICADNHIDPIGYVSDDNLEELLNDFPEISTDVSEVENTSPDTKMEKMKDLVTELAKNVQPVKIRISVRRKSVFKDYLETAKKPWFNGRRMLKVTFIGEPAVDDGGPRREFFSEVLQSIERDLFKNGMPSPDMAALGSDKFKITGELMAGSIVQGGPAPCFLSEEAYAYMVEGVSSITTEGWVPQIKDKKLINAIDQIRNCTTNESLQKLLLEENMMDVLQLIHYRGVPSRETLQSVDNILRPIVMYDFSRYLPMLDQLTAGLSSFGVMDAVKENRVIMEALFVAKHSTCFVPTTDQFLDGIDAAFSEDGSNRKDKEVDIHKFFCDFVQDTDALQEQESNGLNTLSELHKFITGCERIPPLGLPKRISVKFKHGCIERCRCRPTASTCDLSITLPVHYHDNYSQFKESMDSALIEGKGFGLL
ncbi:G2 M phase-specific E3 ubiquitin- ligase-like [Paramuricea clavata]|uniref:HECT-type E3 ubiquitin transferase n=1 Tax=Paramuricea clavata TaxID=317549 RepID=A0A6S7FPQ9_PARCT|nr:G2 M phase-specific E3 ubiquitin- ligase-like [Paramuricea clavata]